MMQTFTIRYNLDGLLFVTTIQARDWPEAEAILHSIKTTGKLAGVVCSGQIDVSFAYEDLRPADSALEH